MQNQGYFQSEAAFLLQLYQEMAAKSVEIPSNLLYMVERRVREMGFSLLPPVHHGGQWTLALR